MQSNRASQNSRRERPRNPTGERSTESIKLPPEEVLDKLPEEVRISVVEAASFTGPLPPPSMYRGYEEVNPGSADRILRMAENEQEHRTTWERRALRLNGLNAVAGQYLGMIIALACICCATYLALNDKTIVAVVLGGVSATTLVGHFLKNRG